VGSNPFCCLTPPVFSEPFWFGNFEISWLDSLSLGVRFFLGATVLKFENWAFSE